MAVLSLVFDILARDRASRELENVGDTADRTGGKLGKLGAAAAAGLGGVIGGAAAAAAGSLASFASGAVDAFAAVQDATGAAGVQFGKALPQVVKFAEEASKGFGISKREALDAQNEFGTLGKAAGLTGGDLAGFSGKLTGLAGDLASFKGTTTEQAIGAVGAALRGENEPLRAYGVLLDDASIRQEALALGLIKTTKDALSPQNKTLAVQAAIFKQTQDAQGDYARTSDSTANVQKTLSAEIENAQVMLGEKLAPALTIVRGGFLQLIQGSAGVIDFLGTIADRVTPLVGSLVTSLAPALGAVKEAFTGFINGFKTGEVNTGGFLGAMQNLGSLLGFVVVPALVEFGEFLSDNIRPVLAVVAGAVGGALVPALGSLGALVAGPVIAAVTALVGVLASPIVLIGALAAGAVLAYKEFEGFREVVDRVGDFIVSTAIPAFRDLAVKAIEFVGKAVEFVKENWPAIRETIETALAAVRRFVVGFVEVVGNLWERFGDNIFDVAKIAFDLIKSTIENALTVIKGVIQVITSAISGDWSGVFEGLRTIASGVFGQIADLIPLALRLIREALQVGLDLIVLAFKTAFEGLKAIIPAAFRAVGDAIGAAFNGAGGILSRVLGFGEDIVDKIVEGIKKAAGKIGKAITGAIGKIDIPGISLPFGDGPGAAAAPRGGSTLNKVSGLVKSFGAGISSTYRDPARNRAVGGSPTSYHLDRNNPAVDIVGTTQQLDAIYARLVQAGPWRELLWRVPNHAPGDNPHIHVAHNGGTVSSGWATMPGLRSDERPAVLQTGEYVMTRDDASALPGLMVTLIRAVERLPSGTADALNGVAAGAYRRSASVPGGF